MEDNQNIYALHQSCKQKREQSKPLWDSISKYTGISVDPNYLMNANTGKAGTQIDEYVDDPTSAISVNQAGDYLVGIMWGTGDNAVEVVPSRYVLEYATKEELKDHYGYVTDQTLYHMNHSDAGFHTALRPYAYDQFSFGTSGIGAFPNMAFERGIDENAFIFRQYGVDNVCIDEGKAGQVDIVFATYHWRTNQIVGEFCGEAASVAKLKKLPQSIQDAYNSGDFNKEFTIVFGMFPSKDYDPKLKGKRGARYRGVWFQDDAKEHAPFHEEYFNEKPINMARQIKIRGEVWGRAYGTLLLSSIRAVNFMLAQGFEVAEKMARPSLGIWNNAVFGDAVLDSSADGLTVFNAALSAGGGTPAFPLYDVGDPSALLEFVIPYLNDKITTAFKVDALLDFNSAKDMTATESLQRYAIRGKSLAGMLALQKNELLVPTVRRCISILENMGQLGVNPKNIDTDILKRLRDVGRSDRIIPEAVLKVKAAGRPWYELKFNNELEKLTRTEAVQNLVQVLQAITAIYSVYPMIVEAVNWYKLLQEINDNLDSNNQILLKETDFKAIVTALAERQQQAMMLQAGQAAAAIGKDASIAKKNTQEAQNGKK